MNSGLEGVVAAETRLSMVDGERGVLVIAGHRVEDLAPRRARISRRWWSCCSGNAAPRSIAKLRLCRRTPRRCCATWRGKVSIRWMRCGCVPARSPRAMTPARRRRFSAPFRRASRRTGGCCTAAWRRLHGRVPIAPRSDLGYAANYLYMLAGAAPHEELVRGMETYLNTVVDHGLNASTFTARVIASTGSDFVSAITGAIGALKGPLHGGAPGPALDMVFEIGDPSRAEEVLRRKIAAGERLMGFGHRGYKVRDPRADVLAAAAERMFTRAGDMHLYELARAVERTALALLEEHRPGRRLQTNVELGGRKDVRESAA